MSTYVGLFNFTDQGIRNIKDSVKRYESAKTLGDKMGVKITQFLYTLGPYDCAAIAEAKDDETFTAFMLAAGALGNVRSVTMRAFTPDEMQRMLAKL